MRIACDIPEATNINSEYVIFIACPQQQWSHDTRLTLISILPDFLPFNRHPFMQSTQTYTQGCGGRSLSLSIHFRGKQCETSITRRLRTGITRAVRNVKNVCAYNSHLLCSVECR